MRIEDRDGMGTGDRGRSQMKLEWIEGVHIDHE